MFQEKDVHTVSKDEVSPMNEVLSHVGDMGLYQVLLFISMLPFGFFWAYAYFGQMFLVATPQEHWCRVPELEGLEPEIRRHLSIPPTASGWETCMMYDANWALVLATLEPPDPSTPTVPCRDGWEFLYEDIPYSTVVSEREWVCDNAILVSWAQSVAFLGSVVGTMIYGWSGDKFGRIPTLLAANLVGCLGGVCTVFTSGFWDFLACRFLVGTSSDSCFMLLFILVMEYVGTRHRTWVANLSIAFFFGGGCIVLPFLALWLKDWRTLSLVMAVPMLVVLLVPLGVPESARWLSSKGKVDRAAAVLKRFERINRSKIPPDVMDNFLKASTNSDEQNLGTVEIFKKPWLRNIVALVVVSLGGCAIAFDVISRLTETLGGDFFITFAAASATELPSIVLIVLFMDKTGRRVLTSGTFTLFAITCLSIIFVPRGVPTAALGVVCRFFINMSYNALLQWAPELLPTPVRVAGVSFSHASAFLGLLIAPFIVYSERVWKPFPLVVSAVLALLGAALVLFLPETKGVPIPQTLEDGKRLADTKRLFRNKTTMQNLDHEKQQR